MFGSQKIWGKMHVRERKYKGKIEEKKKWKKIKSRLKVDKLFLFVTSNSFYLFKLINIKIK